MKKSIVIVAVAFANCFAYAQSSAQISELDLSNEIELPGCSLNIKFKIKRGLASRDWQTLGIRSLDKVTVFQISLNGKRIAVPADFWTAHLADANRIKMPFRPIACGFALDTGDGSESGQVLLSLEKNRIAWIEQWDTHGRRLSRTVFDYPKALVLN
jgi:hypothetical protein